MSKVVVERIIDLCAKKKISVSALEDAIGISNGSVRSWNRVNPSIDKIIKVANYFSVSSDYLLGLSDSQISPGEEDEADPGLTSLKRTRAKMTDAEKRKMDKIIALSFGILFSEEEDGKD